MKTAKATEIKNRFGQYLQSVMIEPIFIEKTNRPIAVLLSLKEYERLIKIEDKYWGEKAKKAEAEGYLSESETKDFIEASRNVKA